MKQHRLIIGLIFLINFSLLGQDFISPDKQWNVRLTGFPPAFSTEIYIINGDSVIDSNLYNKIWVSFDSLVTWQYQGLLREESNIVYYIPPNQNEGILYDFNLEIGDTAFVNNIFCSDIPIYVIDIDTVEYFGTSRKRWHLGEDGYVKEFWIEGIGSLNGPLHTKFSYCIVCPYWELLCYHYNDTLEYIMYGQTDCYQNTVGIENELEINEISIKPNPVKKGQIITIEMKTKALIIDLLDLSGKVIESFSPIAENKISIETSDLSKGMYLLRIQNKKNRIQTMKILIE